MSFTVKQHKEYALSVPAFVCDHPIKENVPVPWNLMLSGYRFIVFCGRPASGKTSLLISCLLDSKILKKTFDNVIVVMPQSSINSLKKNPFKNHDPTKMFESLEEIEQIYKQIKYNASQEESTLLILDDVQSELKVNSIQRLLTHLIANRRHNRCSIIILAQNYNLIPLRSRKLINCIVLWKCQKKEWVNIRDELLEVDEELADKIFKYCFKREENKDGHDWMFLDTVSSRLFSKYSELLINENEDKS